MMAIENFHLFHQAKKMVNTGIDNMMNASDITYHFIA
jgi:hypothetical protein